MEVQTLNPSMNMKKFLLLLTFILYIYNITAQKMSCIFQVLNDIDCQPVDSFDFSLSRGENIPVDFEKKEFGDIGCYLLVFDYAPGTYTITVRKDGYDDAKKQFKVKTLRQGVVNDIYIYLKKMREHQLNEVVVKTTRIKMVMRGDTIVYDADAFNLANGSMLDALVERLPGTELHDGNITVNGKHIESLLINGEDFFSGNPQVALQNLPAYTVKNIKVYDKSGNDSYLKKGKIKQHNEPENMVMDVMLKKEYNTGWIANIEGGYGLPNKRYTGKLFGMGYSERLRIATYANINNISDTQSGSSQGGWNGGWAQDGELKLCLGGLDYLYKKNALKVNGNINMTHEKPFVENQRSTVSFFNTNDVYERELSKSYSHKLHLTSSHSIQYADDNFYLQIDPSIDWFKNESSSNMRNANFFENIIEKYRCESLDSLFSPLYSGIYTRQMISRVYKASEGENGWLITQAKTNTTIPLKETGNDEIKFHIQGNFTRINNTNTSSYNRRQGLFSAVEGTNENIMQNLNKTDKTFSFTSGVEYKWQYSPYKEKNMNVFLITPTIDYTFSRMSGHNTFRRSQELLKNGATNNIVPPSSIVSSLLPIDRENTNVTHFWSNTYNPKLQIYYQLLTSAIEQYYYEITINLNEIIQNERLKYNGISDKTISRTKQFFNPDITLEYRHKPEDGSNNVSEVALTYGYSQSAPSLFYQLGTTNSTDPQNIYIYNSLLHNIKYHNIQASVYRFWGKGHNSLSLNIKYNKTINALANACIYNRETGVKTWKPMNINGNWQLNSNIQYIQPLGKGKCLQFQTNTNFDYINSADYASDTEELIHSVVRTTNLGQSLYLNYRKGSITAGTTFGGIYQHSTSALEAFQTINAAYIFASANTMLNLPLGFQIATDLTLHARRGYNDNTLNTTNWVWNASLSKTFLKDKLTLKLDAVDILGEINNVQHIINAQGRTETWVNSKPHYAMLHLIYKINVMPKKK